MPGPYIEDVFNSITPTTGLNLRKGISVRANVAPIAGGDPTAAVSIGTASGPNIYAGSGAPTITAPQGSLYLRSDGSSTSTRAYINTTGSTTWTAITTAG